MNRVQSSVLSPEAQSRINGELRPGERLVWAGQPGAAAFVLSSILSAIFGLFFGGFAVFWIVGAATAPRFGRDGIIDHLFPLFGVPFALVGLLMMLAPLWGILAARRTVYAITTERAIVVQAYIFNTVKIYSYTPDRLTTIFRTERSNGSGDLVFEQFTQRVGSGNSTTRRGFLRIDHVRDVEMLLNQTLLASRTRVL